MRVFLIALILIFSIQSLSKSDDIAEFEIEGMSVGDSLLDHMTVKEIKKAEEYSSVYPESNYVVISTNTISDLYDYIEFVYDQRDKKYIIEALTGLVDYPDKYQECKKDMIPVSEEFKLTFKGSEIYEDESDHEFAPGSLVDLTDFYPKTGGFARISCTDWAKKYEEEHLWVDSLKISLGSKEFLDYLSNQ